MSVTIYHNPKCSKSRQTLALLRERGIEPTIIEYFRTPPEVAELQQILGLLKLGPGELMRVKESEYRANGLDDEALSDTDLVQAMFENPKLIERPIVLANGKAALGRPPESVLAIL